MSGRPRLLIGTHTYAARGDAARRQSACTESLQALTCARIVNVQFAREPHYVDGIDTLPVLRNTSNSLTGRPGPTKPDVSEIFAALLDALIRASKARGAFALKIETDCHTPSLWMLPLASGPRTWRIEAGPTIQPPTTLHIDLTPEPEAILAAMKPKWRYNIRLAERKGVSVRPGANEQARAPTVPPRSALGERH